MILRHLLVTVRFHDLSFVVPWQEPTIGPSIIHSWNRLIPQSHETGEVAPIASAQHARSVTKAEPVAKPWAHFVAGGYEALLQRIISSTDTITASVV